MPSEAQWEYAARSSGLAYEDFPYPWGTEYPTCSLVNMGGCGGLDNVCKFFAGNTEDDICDMSGNLYEWTTDKWHDDYTDAPTDGSAWIEGSSGNFVVRGGGWKASDSSERLRTTGRLGWEAIEGTNDLGFRCVRPAQ